MLQNYLRQSIPLTRHESFENSTNSSYNSICAYSPKGTMSIVKKHRTIKERHLLESHEAPPTFNFREFPKTIMDSQQNEMIQLEIPLSSCLSGSCYRDLINHVKQVNTGLRDGIIPSLADGAMGGTYFFRDSQNEMKLVCKPGDEEPNSPHNPYQTNQHPSGWGGFYKGHILPGFGMYREVATFLLDAGFAGVPPTLLAKVKEVAFHHASSLSSSPTHTSALSSDYKVCSVQTFVPNICSAEDFGPGLFSFLDVQRIAVLDIRLCNLDRHEGNLLVCDSSPYQHEKSSQPSLFTLTENRSLSEEDEEDLFFHDLEHTTGAVAVNEEEKGPGGNHRLVPIDHGYALPHVLFMGDPSLAWLQWPQVDVPIAPSIREYISSLDADQDIKLLRRIVGAAIPESSLLTLKVCTWYLQMGSEAGLTLRELAQNMCPPDDPSTYSQWTSKAANSIHSVYVSPLQLAVHLAIHRTLLSLECFTCPRSCSPITHENGSMDSSKAHWKAFLDHELSSSSQSVSPTSVNGLFSLPPSPPNFSPFDDPLARSLSEKSQSSEGASSISSSIVRVNIDSLQKALEIDDGVKLDQELKIVISQLIREIIESRS